MLHLSSERVVYVIGGGPSLTGFDFSKLDGYKIGANKAAIVSNSDCLVSMDGNYANKSREELVKFPGVIILAYVRPEEVKNKIPGAHYVKSSRSRGLSKDPQVVKGLNSGYAAVDVAYKFGAKKIALLGFDMKDGPRKHFHSSYYWDTGKGNYKAWSQLFDDVAKTFKSENVKCINFVGPEGSGLTQFETRQLEELQ